MSFGRFVQGWVAATACALTGITLIALGPAPASAATSEITRLFAQSCPVNHTVRRPGASPAQISDAKNDYFRVLTARRHLKPPVNWRQNPIHSHTFRVWLHAFYWISPLIYAYEKQGDVAALVKARNLALDWVRHNPRHRRHLAKEAWQDKVSADRAGFIGYITRASACENILNRSQAGQLLHSMKMHGKYLASPRNYAKHSNHGTFEDYGLALIKGYFPYLRGSGKWGRLASTRYAKHLRRETTGSGVWEEHSAGYQLLSYRLLENFLDAAQGLASSGINALDLRMRRVTAWLTQPDGHVVPWGDTDYGQSPPPVVLHDERDGLSGMRDGGWAVVRHNQSWLGATASYFSGVHKHSDDLSFDLFENGLRIVSDSGRSSSDAQDNFRKGAITAISHSVMTVNGRGFGGKPYRTGIIGENGEKGWYAIAGKNPRILKQKVRHNRLWLYKPGQYLVVVDRVRGRRKNTYRRYFQFGEELGATRNSGGINLFGPGFNGHWQDNTHGKLSLIRGKAHPPIGFYYPSFRKRFPRYTLVATKRVRSMNAVSVFNLTNGNPVPTSLKVTGRTVTVRLNNSATVLTTRFRRGFKGPIRLSVRP